MTKFQDFCKKHPSFLLEDDVTIFLKFKGYNPNLSGKEAKRKLEQEITELFFNRCSKDTSML